jgi:hypothetical protein
MPDGAPCATQRLVDSSLALTCPFRRQVLPPLARTCPNRTGTLTFATIWEILKFDVLIFMLRGARPLAELTVFRQVRFALLQLTVLIQVCACIRLAIRGASELGRPAGVPAGLEYATIQAMVAYEDFVPRVMRRHSEHVVLHLVCAVPSALILPQLC